MLLCLSVVLLLLPCLSASLERLFTCKGDDIYTIQHFSNVTYVNIGAKCRNTGLECMVI